ncbi:hypothetical protein GCM10022243_63630 [Saccharothrix violaceirubra]|uniref:helix-turn-helix domain-containing protein n=1 Tax=Saccharothrix violaceirubra TaxID=413306 RepID=UPI0031E7440B
MTTRQNPGPARQLLSVDQAARVLAVGRTTMFNLLRTGAVASIRIGRLRRIPETALAEFTARLATEQGAA